MGWQDTQRAESADNRLDFASRPKPSAVSTDNRPLTPSEIDRVTRIALSSSPQKSWNQALKEYLLVRPKPEEVPDYTPDKLPFTDGQRIEHVQSLTNGQPTRVTSQASLYARDQNPVLRHLGGMVDEIKALEANAEARLDAFEARHRGDVPSETYRRTAVNAEQAKYERRAVFTNMVTRYCLAERKKGRSSLTYAQAEAECKALAGKA